MVPGELPPPRGRKTKNDKKATRRTHLPLSLRDSFVEGFLRVLDPHHRGLKLASHLRRKRSGLDVNVFLPEGCLLSFPVS